MEPFVTCLLLGKQGRVLGLEDPLSGLCTSLLCTPESSSHTAGHRCFSLLSHPGCFVSGLYLEGADWDIERGCLVKSKPKVLVVDLPILKIIPIEGHRLKLQVTVLSRGTLGGTVMRWGQFRGKLWCACMWESTIHRGQVQAQSLWQRLRPTRRLWTAGAFHLPGQGPSLMSCLWTPQPPRDLTCKAKAAAYKECSG